MFQICLRMTIHYKNIGREGGDRIVEIYMGDSLRILQKKLNVSQDEMAYTVCLSQATLSKYMNDKLPVPFDFIISILERNKEIGKQLAREWKSRFDDQFWEAVI